MSIRSLVNEYLKICGNDNESEFGALGTLGSPPPHQGIKCRAAKKILCAYSMEKDKVTIESN